MARGRRGPAPEPAAVKKAKGNSGRRPINTAEMEDAANKAVADIDTATATNSPTNSLMPPDWLNDDGKKIWSEIAPRLAAMKILQSIDTNTFGRYCQDFGRWVKLQKVLDGGTTYESESPHGTYHRSHPAFMQADRLNRTLQIFESNFALNPADRQRLFASLAQAAYAGGLFDSPPNPDDKPNSKSPIGRLN